MKSTLSMLAAGAFLAAASGASADTIKIGHISNFSGPFAVWGKQFSQTIKAYQKVHGDTVNGHKIEVVYRDVGAVNPAKARQLAEELILREKIKVLTGFSLTPNALAVAETITEARMPCDHERGNLGHYPQVAVFRACIDDCSAVHQADAGVHGQEAERQEGLCDRR